VRKIKFNQRQQKKKRYSAWFECTYFIITQTSGTF